MRYVLLALMMCTGIGILSSEDSAYNAWMQNRPHEAIPLLYEKAQASDAWYDYFDLGLAAYDNGDHGKAVVWLLQAQQRAPYETGPRKALQAMDVELPTSWLVKLGPLASPGIGLTGIIIMLLSGLFLGLGIFLRDKRWPLIISGSICLIIALPGTLAHSLDSQNRLLACVRDCPLLGATGQPLQTLAAGSILIEEKRLSGNRILVRLLNGQRGFIDSTYCDAKAQP